HQRHLWTALHPNQGFIWHPGPQHIGDNAQDAPGEEGGLPSKLRQDVWGHNQTKGWPENARAAIDALRRACVLTKTCHHSSTANECTASTYSYQAAHSNDPEQRRAKGGRKR